MDARFRDRVERALRLGLENRAGAASPRRRLRGPLCQPYGPCASS
jgi:hypothetical protein